MDKKEILENIKNIGNMNIKKIEKIEDSYYNGVDYFFILTDEWDLIKISVNGNPDDEEIKEIFGDDEE